MSPPARAFFSMTVVLYPSLDRKMERDSPPIPEPMIKACAQAALESITASSLDKYK